MKNAILFILSIMPINAIYTTIQSLREISLIQDNNRVDPLGNFFKTRTKSFIKSILLIQYSSFYKFVR